MAHPIIGVPCTNDESARWHQLPVGAVQRSYIDAVIRAGGAPLLIPTGQLANAMEQIVERVDGLLLAGGEDVSPRFYGTEQHATVKRVDEDRDITELWLARWALTHNLPLLALCRGLQVLNVAGGGTL